MDSLAWFKRFLTRGDQRFHRNDKLKFFRELDLLQFFPQWTKLADVLRLFTTVTLLPFYRADFAGFQPTTNVFFFRHGCFSASTSKIHFFVNTVPFLQITSKIWSLGLTVIFLSNCQHKLCPVSSRLFFLESSLNFLLITVISGRVNNNNQTVLESFFSTVTSSRPLRYFSFNFTASLRFYQSRSRDLSCHYQIFTTVEPSSCFFFRVCVCI